LTGKVIVYVFGVLFEQLLLRTHINTVKMPALQLHQYKSSEKKNGYCSLAVAVR